MVGDIETHVIKYVFNDIINHSFVLNLCSQHSPKCRLDIKHGEI